MVVRCAVADSVRSNGDELQASLENVVGSRIECLVIDIIPAAMAGMTMNMAR